MSFADYPASEGWVFSLALVPTFSATAAPLEWDTDYVATNGEGFRVTLPADTTADLVAGAYKLTAFVTLSDVRYSPYSSHITVTADEATQETGDGLSDNRKVLAQIDALIDGRTIADVASYQINGRALNREPLAELLKLQRIYRQRVWQEEHPGETYGTRYVTFLPCG